MFKKIMLGSVMICGLLLASCGQQKNVGADGYRFEEATLDRKELNVKIVFVQSNQEMNALEKEHNAEAQPGYEIAAFATYSQTEPHCTIYAIDPKVNYQPEWIGHELVHCVYGVWHKSQP